MDNSWNNIEGYSQADMNFQPYSPHHHQQLKAGFLMQSPPIIHHQSVSDYDPHYSGIPIFQTTCLSPYTSGRNEPFTSYMPSIKTTTKSYSVKRDKKSSSYSRWTLEEDELLRQAVQLYGSHKWSLIAAHIPNRTPMQCCTRWLGALNSKIHRGRWTENEDNILSYSVMEYANMTDAEGKPQPIPWNKIAERIPHRTGIQCQARWTEALDPYVRKGKWSEEENALLKMGVEEFGKRWIKIAELIPGRTQRQCRTRWMQIQYKKDRKKLDEASSQSSSEEEEEAVEKETKEEQPHSFFITDAAMNKDLFQNTTPNSIDELFLSTDWNMNAYHTL